MSDTFHWDRNWPKESNLLDKRHNGEHKDIEQFFRTIEAVPSGPNLHCFLATITPTQHRICDIYFRGTHKIKRFCCSFSMNRFKIWFEPFTNYRSVYGNPAVLRIAFKIIIPISKYGKKCRLTLVIRGWIMRNNRERYGHVYIFLIRKQKLSD